MRDPLFLFMAVITLTISGCSSSYEIQAQVVDGKLTFAAAGTGLFSEPDCIRSITVEIVNGPIAVPVSGDDLDAIKHGTYWHEEFAPTSCENPLPITYGARLVGQPPISTDELAKSVKSKPLVFGATYDVKTVSSGSAYGGGRFHINETGQVINLSL